MKSFGVPGRPRSFNVPGGKVGKIVVAVCELATSIFTLVVSFIPSTALQTATARHHYLIILTICFVIGLIIPIVISAFRDKYDQHSEETIKHLEFEEKKDN